MHRAPGPVNTNGGGTAPGAAEPRASAGASFDGAARALGAPELLVANAGAGMPVAEMDDAEPEQVLRTDLTGPLWCARTSIRQRIVAGGNGGRTLFMGSVAGHMPTPGSAPYGMAKAGAHPLVRSLSREPAPMRVNVNVIAPGLIATPTTRARLDVPEKRAESKEAIPWGRPGRPECIAGLAVFPASDAADTSPGGPGP